MERLLLEHVKSTCFLGMHVRSRVRSPKPLVHQYFVPGYSVSNMRTDEKPLEMMGFSMSIQL